MNIQTTISLPTTPFSQFQSSLKSSLDSYLITIGNQRVDQSSQNPLTTFDPLVVIELSSALNVLWSQLPSLPSTALELQRSIVSSVLTSIVSQTAYPAQHSFSLPVHHQLLHDALDISLVLIEQDRAPADLTLSCIEDILETATVEEAERIFCYLESRVDRLTVGMLPDRGKGLIFLRMQNNLLRRLSKSLHTVFCGRILSFLSSVFPIAEKSGVNLRGAFNTGNVTHFDQDIEKKGVEAVDSQGSETIKSDPVVETNLLKSNETTADAMIIEKSLPASQDKPIPSDEPASTDPKIQTDSTLDGENVEKSFEMKEESPEEVAARSRAKADEQEARAKAKAASKAGKLFTMATPTLLTSDKREFYLRFWALQSLLSNPPELFKGWQPDPNATPATVTPQSNPHTYPSSRPTSLLAPSTSLQRASPVREVEAAPSTANLKRLKEGINKTLDVFGRMTKKEKELGTHSKKPKIDERNLAEVKEHYFFPKFLTKSNLLDLEVADSYFRRQVLTQFLIILKYIRGFSLEERNKRAALPKPNRVSEVPYVYQARDDGWVRKLNGEVWKTLYATPPNGEVFALTIKQILTREQNWIMWKAGSCPSFERPSLGDEMIKAAEANYKRIIAPPMRFPHPVGTPALSKLWSNKVTPESIESMDFSEGVPDLNALHGKIMAQEKQLSALKESLLAQGKSDTDVSNDPQVQAIQERKSSLSWRALRVAQTTHLQLFGKIGLPGSVNKLMTLIEDAKTRSNGINSTRQLATSNQMVSTPTGTVVTDATQITPGTSGIEAESDLLSRTKDGDENSVQLVASSDNHDGQPLLDPFVQPDIVMLDGESIEDTNPVTSKSLPASETEEEEPAPAVPANPDPAPPISIPPPLDLQPQKPQPQPQQQQQPPPPPPPPSQVNVPHHPHVPNGPSRFNNHHHHLSRHQSPATPHSGRLHMPSHRNMQVNPIADSITDIDQVIRRAEARAAPELARSHA
ncbi:uncharacterized protein MELLADRAFT_118113 [Melampsora larici-populina 98AG31]|uniref:Uncharacterized protein n=1 Tax=Melampsora larici-populina (strain 98AG31 / pathotype 3-4-7) TaxID=747676 RepID=F4S587_MELLP|nr:uncharacterized protein MELLADRAFT_118113 [Melampsora larici-populina 98AG31]EGG00202.1 hypothetical protein MELLADRAFT_118113 [Melampsora larici-populina 98AG31]